MSVLHSNSPPSSFLRGVRTVELFHALTVPGTRFRFRVYLLSLRMSVPNIRIARVRVGHDLERPYAWLSLPLQGDAKRHGLCRPVLIFQRTDGGRERSVNVCSRVLSS